MEDKFYLFCPRCKTPMEPSIKLLAIHLKKEHNDWALVQLAKMTLEKELIDWKNNDKDYLEAVSLIQHKH